MAEKKGPGEGVRMTSPKGTRVTASPELAETMKKNWYGGSTDTRRSTDAQTLDSSGIARTSSFEQQFADQPSGGRVPGSDPVAGEPGFRQVESDGNTRPTKSTGRTARSSDKS